MNNKKFTISDFKNNYPDWKRKKDSFFVRYVFRPISFPISVYCANHNISANTVSVFSVIVGLIACSLFFIDSFIMNVGGAILILFWLLLDLIDGNLSRTVGHQPFGDFVDALSSYTLVAFLGVSLGLCVFNSGGVLIKQGNYICLVLGAIASTSDTLMRLSYQKYLSNKNDLEEKGVIPKEIDVVKDHESVNSLLVKIEMEFGLAGFLPLAILICTLLHALDFVIFYMLLYYTGSAIVMIPNYVRKAMKYRNIRLD